MNNILIIPSRSELDAKASLELFVKNNRLIKPLGYDQSFESNAWGFGHMFPRNKAKSENRLHFTRLDMYGDELSTGKKYQGTPFNEPFLSFAKAMFNHLHSTRGLGSADSKLTALRYMEYAQRTLNGNSDPWSITPQELNFATQKIVENYESAYYISNQLDLIYREMVDQRLVSLPTVWTTFVPSPEIQRRRSDKEFDAVRNKRLPSPEALLALAHIRNHSQGFAERFIGNITYLMLCSPDRIVETLTLPKNCIVWKDGSKKQRMGLRWFPAKNNAPLVKDVLPIMKDVAQVAVDELIAMTDQARVVAKWYEENPDQIYLLSKHEHFRTQEWLSYDELNAILFDGKHTSITAYCHYLKLNLRKFGRTNLLRFQEVEQAILSLLPAGFPVLDITQNLKYSEALCVSRLNEMSGRAIYVGMIHPVNYSQVNSRISAKTTSKIQNIFEKHNLRNPDGTRIHLTTHMLRHYGNTVMQAGGLDEMIIAKLSGRKVTTNRAYDHESDRDVVDKVRKALGPDLVSKVAKAIGDKSQEDNELVTTDTRVYKLRAEFPGIKVISAHTTELGYCIHNFASEPCPLHGDHIHCEKSVYIKGDSECEHKVRFLHKETETLLDIAHKALTEEEYGADKWVSGYESVLERTTQIIGFFENTEIVDGAGIVLAGPNGASRILQSMELRLEKHGSVCGINFQSLDELKQYLENQSTKIENNHA
ncbi:MAG: hypothetical protein ACT6RZ_05655 [Methylophilus sp.]|uniref:hypothetical protein n=1 Tax=Methylophilus sp. TaxID=29541 RepID=UPI004036D498